MKVFQIGAGGGVGLRLAERLTRRGDDVTGMHRRPGQAEGIAATGATPAAGDLIDDSAEELAAKIAGHDAVVFSAGAHGTGIDQTTLIDGKGLEKAADAAALAGVLRFVLVSVFPDAGRDQDPGERFEHYMRVKKTADVYLTNTDLDWVIVRPGTLTDEPGDGNVAAGLAIEYGDVRRNNVAAFIEATLHHPQLSRIIVELTDGATPAEQAVADLHMTLPAHPRPSPAPGGGVPERSAGGVGRNPAFRGVMTRFQLVCRPFFMAGCRSEAQAGWGAPPISRRYDAFRPAICLCFKRRGALRAAGRSQLPT